MLSRLKKEAKIYRAIGEKQHRRRDEREQRNSWSWDTKGAMHSLSSWVLFLRVLWEYGISSCSTVGVGGSISAP